MEINKNGYWVTEYPVHWFDRKLCYFLLELLTEKRIKSLVDFGCGNADYTRYFSERGIKCEAYDGNPFTEKITKGFGKVLDLSQPIDLNEIFDCVLSLETGEHIPQQYETNFIDNIVNHTNNLIILSWAIPNQGGEGHYNERENKYIIKQLEKREFKINKEETLKLREKSSIDWFKHTIMVFER